LDSRLRGNDKGEMGCYFRGNILLCKSALLVLVQQKYGTSKQLCQSWISIQPLFRFNRIEQWCNDFSRRISIQFLCQFIFPSLRASARQSTISITTPVQVKHLFYINTFCTTILYSKFFIKEKLWTQPLNCFLQFWFPCF
jgi:hypothetical protein